MTVPAALPTVTGLLLARADDPEQGLRFEDRRWSWREHVGECALAGAVLVALNPVRRGEALARDVTRADCQYVLAEPGYAALLPAMDVPVLPLDGLDLPARAPLEVAPARPDDLLMLIFTSGTSGEPKAVRCTHAKIAVPGRMLAGRFGLGTGDTVYVSMPMFHSNAIMAGWAVGLAAGAAIALRRRFSAAGFLPDVRAFGATYANYVGKPLSYVLATPERADDADGMYWSGDLGYTDSRGFCWFAGRAGQWLRVDGENLGTAPIERALLRHPAIAEAAVYGVPDPGEAAGGRGGDQGFVPPGASRAAGDQVMGCIVMRDGASLTPAELGAFLAAQGDIGRKQHPRFVRVTGQLPRTATFKVLTRVLAADRWNTGDPVWWRPDVRSPGYVPLGQDQAAALDAGIRSVR